jgi:serine phosphatase RsbU (regulator of sigma subunit)
VTPAPRRLLVVDDTEANRDLLQRRLSSLGHEVLTAENGRQALDVLAAHEVDLVLLDIMMPEMDGFQVLERLRGDPERRHIPVIMISAVDEIDSVVRAIELGAADYLPKPFNAVVLRARVTATLEKKHLEDLERLHTRGLEKELEIGRQIQSDFLPEALPQLPGWEIAAAFQPARQVSGDFYDAFALEDGRIALVLADVCDKGVGAALFMALFRSLLRAFATEDDGTASPGETLSAAIQQTNDYIATTHGKANMFATVFFGVLDPVGRARLRERRARAPAAPAPGDMERLMPTGPAAGAMPGMEFSAKTTRLSPGDLLLAFTDGVTEARSPSGAFYGEQRLLRLLSPPPATASALLAAIVASVREHEAGAEPTT